MNINFDPYWCYIHPQTPNDKRIALEYLNAVKGKKGYRIPKNIWALRELCKMFPALLKNESFIAEGTRLKHIQEQFLHGRKTMLYFDPSEKLRPYQAQDVATLMLMPCAGVFNEPRTGKTPTIITLIKALGTQRNLIIAPASLIWNWAKEFEIWCPHANVYVASGTPVKRKEVYERYAVNVMQTCILIVSRDVWKSDLDYWKGYTFDLAAVDEAQFLRNYKTAQSKAVYKIKAERRYVLSGTPTIKHPIDIWGILHFLYPNGFPSYWQFADRYFEQSTDWMGHNIVGNPKKHREKELTEMIALLSTQRKRKEVMQWLPDKQHSTFLVHLGTKQQKLYEDMANFFYASDGGTEIDTLNVISQLMRLRQLCLDPRLLGFDTEGAKTVALLEYLDSHREPIVIMSMFTSYLKLLQPMIEKLGLKVGFIHGEMSNQQKTEYAQSFQGKRLDVLLCNIISAGVGFTLDASNTVIFTDKPWNPSDLEQAEDRICPTTEDKNHKHEIITFTCENTVDERIDEVLAQKKSLTDYINEGGRDALKNLMRG